MSDNIIKIEEVMNKEKLREEVVEGPGRQNEHARLVPNEKMKNKMD